MDYPLSPTPTALQFQPAAVATPTYGITPLVPVNKGLNLKLILTVLAVIVAIAVATKMFGRRENFDDYTVAPMNEQDRWAGAIQEASPADFGTGTPILDTVPALASAGPNAAPEQSSLSGSMDLAYADNAAPTGAQVQCNPISSVAADLLPKPEQGTDDYDQYAPKALKGQNFLDASRFIGASTGSGSGSSLKLSSYDIRSTIPNPKGTVGPWNNSSIEPDHWRKPLE